MKREYHVPIDDYQFAVKTEEAFHRCVAQASPFYVNSAKFYRQCSRKRGYGPNGEYCVQHARATERR